MASDLGLLLSGPLQLGRQLTSGQQAGVNRFVLALLTEPQADGYGCSLLQQLAGSGMQNLIQLQQLFTECTSTLFNYFAGNRVVDQDSVVAAQLVNATQQALTIRLEITVKFYSQQLAAISVATSA